MRARPPLKARADRRAWLAARDYAVVEVTTNDVDADIAKVLDALAAKISL